MHTLTCVCNPRRFFDLSIERSDTKGMNDSLTMTDRYRLRKWSCKTSSTASTTRHCCRARESKSAALSTCTCPARTPCGAARRARRASTWPRASRRSSSAFTGTKCSRDKPRTSWKKWPNISPDKIINCMIEKWLR